MAEFTLQIDGMHCGSCVRRVSQALASVEGVAVNEVRVGAARLTSAVEPPRRSILPIAALAKAGYAAHLEAISDATPATESLTLPVLGMTCASCQHHVEEALRSTAGVESARVDLMAHRASVVFDPAAGRARSNWSRPFAARATTRCFPAPVLRMPARRTAIGPTESARKAVVTLIAGAAAMLLAMPLGAQMGALDHALMRLLPWLYALPPDPLRWFLLVLTAAVVAWAGRGIYLSAIARPAPRHHQHEHAGQPGNGRGLCLLRLCHDLARARPPGLLRRGSADSRLSAFGQSA